MSRTAGPLADVLAQAATSHQKAVADLDRLQSAAAAARESLAETFRQIARTAALTGFDQDQLQAFLERPYILVRNDERLLLYVPRFLNVHVGGWLVRHEGAYSLFEVSRMAHLISPLPDFLARELGYGEPSFAAHFEGEALVVERGDTADLARRLGSAVRRVRPDRLDVRPGRITDVYRRLIREEGLIPFAPRPLPAHLLRDPLVRRDEAGHRAYTLRAHQADGFQRFLEAGSVLVTAYPQTGKTFLCLEALACLQGPKLIAVPSRALVEQWRARLALYLQPEAAAEVTLTTYQGAEKHLGKSWTLFVADEAQRVPADFAIRTAMHIRTEARIGLSATPFREDGQHDLLPLLCGFPIGADWPIGEGQRPTVTVWLVPHDRAKVAKAQELCAAPPASPGHTLVFSQYLQQGERLGRALNVPFVSGRTPARQQLQLIQEHSTIVVSSIADMGLSVPVSRVIEASFLFGSRMQAGQRLGRLAHEFTGKRHAGEHHVLMTPLEYDRYAKRLLAYEGWGLEVDIRAGDEVSAHGARSGKANASRRPRLRARPSARAGAPASGPDPVSLALALPGVQAKLAEAAKTVGATTLPYLLRVFRYVFEVGLSSKEMADGLGIYGASRRSRLNAACKALAEVGLLKALEEGTYRVDRDLVQRQRVLADLRRR